MRVRLSLPFRVVAVILLVSGLVGLAHYLASRTLMTDALRDIQSHNAKNAHALVTGDIVRGVAHIREIAALLKRHPGLAEAAVQDHAPMSVRQERLKQVIDALGPLLGINIIDVVEGDATHQTLEDIAPVTGNNIIEVFDRDETVLYSTHPPIRRANKLGIWGVFEALSGDEVVVTSEDRGLVIRAIVPLITPRGVEAALAVGLRIDDQTLRKWVGTQSMALVLVNAKGATLASSAGAQPIDPALIAASLRSKDDVNHTHTGDWTTTTYFDMAIVDQTYVWITRQDSSGVFTSFDYARKVELLMSVLLAAASALLLGWLAWRHARAITQLQRQTEGVIAREFGEAAPRLGGSEIAQLTSSVQLMEERLVTRAHELRNSYDAVEAASRSRNEFFASVSHELRTPINAVLGYAHYARQRSRDPALDSDLKKIDGAANALLFLVNDILDYAKIESGQFEIQPMECDLDDLLQSVVDMTAPAAQKKDLEFIVEMDAAVPQHITVDPMRLRQILVNLCSNAVKFTTHGEIVLGIRIVPDASRASPGNSIEFTVRDTGIGVSEAQQALLFTPFTQGKSRTHASADQNGTGLGLALCKKLTQMLGGHIRMQSTPGTGTCITVAFADTSATRTAALAQPGAGKQVLVVEDNDTLRGVLCNLLSGLGYAALGAVDSDAALAALGAPGQAHGEMAAVLFGENIADTAQIIEQLEQAAPKPKFLFLCNRNDLPDAAELDGDMLQKPVTRLTLLSALQNRIAAPWVAPRPARREKPLEGMRVLLAEDNESNQEIAMRALGDAGAVVVLSDNGQKAVEAVLSQPFDVVIMDVQMPVMNGIEATRAIRADARLRTLPIIGVTASAIIGDRDTCLAAGMTEYVTKPISPDRFIDVIARYHDAASRTAAAIPAPNTTAAIGSRHALSAIAAAGFDVPRGLIMAGGEAQYLRTLSRFIDDASTVIGSAREMLARHDVEAAVREVHRVTGHAALLGAAHIHQAANAAEKAIFADAPDCDARLTGLDTLIQKTVRELNGKHP